MKKLILDNIKIIAVVIGTILGSGSVWAVHSYLQAEALHEKDQDGEIIAGKQDRYQQSLNWYDMKIIDYSIKYGCKAEWVQNVPTTDPAGSHHCKGAAWEQFQQVIWERNTMYMKLQKLKEG